MDLLQDQPLLLALVVFVARILDVSIGTLRTILIIRGYRVRGSILGFFEILVWVAAAAQVITNLDEWYLLVAYAGGFAVGNYIGSWLESQLALGAEIVRAISKNPEVNLSETLNRERFGVVQLTGHGSEGVPVEVLLVVESRRRVPGLLRLIRETDPDAVCTISDARIPSAPLPLGARRRGILGGWRNASKRK